MQTTLTYEDGNLIAFLLVHGDFKNELRKSGFNVQKGLEGGRDGAVKGAKGTLVSEKKIKKGGHRGIEFLVSIPSDVGPLEMKSEVYLISRKRRGRKIKIEQYQAAVVYPPNPSPELTARIETFLASVEVKK